MMTESRQKKPGFFTKDNSKDTLKKGSGLLDKSYKPDPQPKTLYRPEPTIETNNSSRSTQGFGNKSERKSLVLPAEQYYQFMALLDQSAFSYTYELLGDQMQPQIDKMSQVERQMFDMKVAQLREKDEKKKRTRKKS